MTHEHLKELGEAIVKKSKEKDPALAQPKVYRGDFGKPLVYPKAVRCGNCLGYSQVFGHPTKAPHYFGTPEEAHAWAMWENEVLHEAGLKPYRDVHDYGPCTCKD